MDIIFGPVQSRRFGESLGVDLSPKLKQCNYDCLYCELEGKKAQESMREVLSVDEILEAIKQGLEKFPNVESLTITANGEPTLYPHLYELMLRLEDIKGDKQTLLLTNGALLWDLCVARACLLFDKVKFSLDAVSERVFKKIDRAYKSVDLAQILKGIYQFSADFKGELYAEILFVKGVNDNPQEIQEMARFLAPMPLKRLDISTIDRPPAYKVESLSLEELERIGQVFLHYKIPTFVPKRKQGSMQENLQLSQDEILKTLALRPMSESDINMLWSMESKKILESLIEIGKVKQKSINGVNFYALR
ncbi:molybdenum cofactor biosynthesis protein MoaA [Helicobacter winghamensis]|uniref:Molybdenum cofactor biosynthesis protein MoaA n=1 Tax=Helicobacter winghamensis TaxID=157268 RepID=A0A2N3PIQ7_9HELI|nr:radical SAM protein [Helicobacter winghamensis]EEO25259.1 radical SAM domain protein [Helicobacter winghamensis ATCC BAA-430]PKT76302.1 molybdenum cofactor biosynthesis protein MoaA [Helicobacter winghamensis]PKT76433.1 molybdenum cofactor biosynthesis protein MoaA [Helicobacter winghamensis]PKT76564.1 molybdenum cofactor biosynthesis protein MoaA [Helicobacter winghamensis]PKT80813.1 molybdenum cofactor biosynthesis protein MoaA [Helicobacter winghamensis]